MKEQIQKDQFHTVNYSVVPPIMENAGDNNCSSFCKSCLTGMRQTSNGEEEFVSINNSREMNSSFGDEGNKDSVCLSLR